MESQEVESLIDRLDQAEERGTIITVLGDIKKALSKIETWQSELLIKAVFSSQAKFVNYLTNSEIYGHLSDILKQIDAVSRVLVLFSLFRDGSNNVHTFLLSSLGPDGLEAVLQRSISASPEEERFDAAVNCLVSIPSRLSNFVERLVAADRTALIDWTKSYPVNIFTALCKTLQLIYNKIQSKEDVNLKAISLLLSKGRNIDLQDLSLLTKTVRWFSQQDSSPIWDRIAQRVFTDDSHGIREYEAMLTALIHTTRNKQEIIRCLGYNLEKNNIIRSTIRRLLLQRICPYHVPHVLSEYIAEAAGPEIFLAIFQEIIAVWSDVVFIKFNPVEKQNYLTVCLLEFGRNVNNINLNHTWNNLSAAIINGVHLRLANSDPAIRESGFFVGEMCSKWKGDEEPMVFDYKESNWVREMKRIAVGIEEEEKFLDKPEATTSYVETTISDLHIKPKEEEIDSDDEFEFEGEIPEEERNFEKLKEGEEPEKFHPPPNYIGDAMEWLMEKDKYEKFEAAFFNLEPMIRRRALGFNDIASKLIIRLIHLEDRFSSKNFEQIQKSCLVSCLVIQPELAPSLAEVLFSRNCAFSTRYLILNCLLEAAKELSESLKTEKVMVKELKTDNASEWRSIVDARIKAKTRIISEKKPVAATQTNRFAPVATLFFYPLLRTTTGEHLELQGRDAPFLAKILVVAAEVLQCGSTSSSVVKMAISLSTLVWSLRFHDEKVIREAVMFCFFSIISSLSVQVFFEVFKNETNSWLEWICSVADNVDLGEQERTLARHVASILFENARQLQEAGRR